jgi:hypothetical protein
MPARPEDGNRRGRPVVPAAVMRRTAPARPEAPGRPAVLDAAAKTKTAIGRVQVPVRVPALVALVAATVGGPAGLPGLARGRHAAAVGVTAGPVTTAGVAAQARRAVVRPATDEARARGAAAAGPTTTGAGAGTATTGVPPGAVRMIEAEGPTIAGAPGAARRGRVTIVTGASATTTEVGVARRAVTTAAATVASAVTARRVPVVRAGGKRKRVCVSAAPRGGRGATSPVGARRTSVTAVGPRPRGAPPATPPGADPVSRSPGPVPAETRTSP